MTFMVTGKFTLVDKKGPTGDLDRRSFDCTAINA